MILQQLAYLVPCIWGEIWEDVWKGFVSVTKFYPQREKFDCTEESWAYDTRILKMQIDGGHVVCCDQWTVSTSANVRPWRYMWPLGHLFFFWGEHRARKWIKWHGIKEICLQSRSVILESQQTYSGLCLNDKETLYTKSLWFAIASYSSIHLA